MPETPTTEPWAGTPPVPHACRPGALPEAYMAKMLVPDESITTWIDISGDPVERKWAAMLEHVTQIAKDSPFMLFGLDGWRESSVATEKPESDLFAGLT